MATTQQRYLKRAFSAPRICTVEAGYLARFVRLPACEMRRAPTWGGGGQDGRYGHSHAQEPSPLPPARISSERCQQDSSED